MWLVGEKPVLKHATKIKPYAFFLHGRFHPTVPNNNQSTIICLGDSNCFGLWRMLGRALKKQGIQREVIVRDWVYGGAAMFDYYCMFHRARRFSPDIVIIPINWRSFSSVWLGKTLFFHPELTAFVPLGEQFPPEYENPLELRNISSTKHLKFKMLLFRVYPLGIKMWARDGIRDALRKFLSGDTESETTSRRSRRTGKRERAFFEGPKYVRHNFPMRITHDNLTFRTLRSLAYSASQQETKILFFIWPLDQEHFADVGILRKDELERSIQYVREAITAHATENIYFMDLSGFLGHQYFRDSGGHCTFAGRRKIAGALASKVRQILDENPHGAGAHEPALASRPEASLNENSSTTERWYGEKT